MQLHDAMILAQAAGSLAAIRATVDVYANLEHPDPLLALNLIRAEAVTALEQLNGHLGIGDNHVCI